MDLSKECIRQMQVLLVISDHSSILSRNEYFQFSMHGCIIKFNPKYVEYTEVFLLIAISCGSGPQMLMEIMYADQNKFHTSMTLLMNGSSHNAYLEIYSPLMCKGFLYADPINANRNWAHKSFVH